MRPSATRVAFLFLTANSSVQLTGSGREEHLDTVWAMYRKSYSTIGMSIPNAAGLLKYDTWDLDMVGGQPVAFTLFKRTSYGLKAGAVGSDGTPEGKAATIHNLRTKYRQPGVYGEVSHKVQEIALAAGAPVVCAALAPVILGKPVEQVSDLEYRRNLEGVGNVKKMLVGRPRGVPTTDADHPSCPHVAFEPPRVASADDHSDLDAHYACVT